MTEIQEPAALDRLAHNVALLAGAISTLAAAVNGDYKGLPIGSGPSTPPAEPQKRGRGRPVKGEDQPATDVASPVAGSTSAAIGAVAASSAVTQTTAPVSDAADPFASPKAAIEDVRAALTALKAASSQDAALAVLKKAGGAGNLTDLPSEKYGVVVAAVNVELRIIEAGKKPAVAETDPFEVPATAATPASKPLTIEDVKAAVVAATKRTGTDIVQKLVMEHGGKANNPETGAPAPSLKAIPKAQYEALVKAISELPTTK